MQNLREEQPLPYTAPAVVHPAPERHTTPGPVAASTDTGERPAPLTNLALAPLLAIQAWSAVALLEFAVSRRVRVDWRALLDVAGANAILAVLVVPILSGAIAAVTRLLGGKLRDPRGWHFSLLHAGLWFVSTYVIGAAAWYFVARALGADNRRDGAVYLLVPSLIAARFLSRRLRSVPALPLLGAIVLVTYAAVRLTMLEAPPPVVLWAHGAVTAAFFFTLTAIGALVVTATRRGPGRLLLAGSVSGAVVMVFLAGYQLARWSGSLSARDAAVRGSPLSRTAARVVRAILLRDEDILGRMAAGRPAPADSFAPSPSGSGRDLGARMVSEARPRNVLLLTVDTFRADLLGPALPNMNRLREEGVAVLAATSSSSNTRESFRAMMVGTRSPTGSREQTLAEVFQDSGLATVAIVPYEGFLDDTFSRGFERFDTSLTKHAMATRTAPRVVERLWEGLSAVRPRPFFAWAHFLDPHLPYDAPGETERARYLGDLQLVDREIGALLEKLEGEQLLEDTLVILTSDHGEEFMEHGGTSHGRTLYREVLEIPLVFRAAGGSVRGTADLPAAGVDLAPTVIAVAGVTRPPGFAPDGVDLFTASVDRSVVSGSAVARLPSDVRSRQLAVRRGRWKLIVNVSLGSAELYDLASDAEEQHNVVDGRPDVAAALARDLVGIAGAAAR